MNDRYLRQRSIPNWNQKRLDSSRIAIVGADGVAAAVSAGAAAMGIGQISLVSDAAIHQNRPAPFLCVGAGPGIPIVQAMRNGIEAINPHVEVTAFSYTLASDAVLHCLPKPDVLVATTSSESDLRVCAAYCRDVGIPLVVAVGNQVEGVCSVLQGDLLEGSLVTDISWRHATYTPGGAVACVIGGIALGEVRACLMPLHGDDQPSSCVMGYSLLSASRLCTRPLASADTAWHDSSLQMGPYSGSESCVHLVGAGALANWFCIALAGESVPPGIRLKVWDHDTVEEHNLNRQVLLAGSVGKPKAVSLADALRRIAPGMDVQPVEQRVSTDQLEETPDAISAIVSAVDNFATRAALNAFCVSNGVPMVNAGSGPYQADAQSYVPGLSACLDCQIGIGRLADEESSATASCAAAPESSTVITNMVAGGMACGELMLSLMDPPRPPGAVLVYDMFAPPRVGIRSRRPPCAHDAIPEQVVQLVES